MKYKKGDDIYLKGRITDVSSCSEASFSYEVNTADEFIDVREEDIASVNEPEKATLNEEEVEWLEQLKKVKSFLNCLYIITRQGWGHDFEFYIHEEKYKLSYRDDNDEDSEQTKNRLVNALLYGYEIKKDKLYTARLKVSGEYLNSEKANKKYMMGSTNKNYVKELKSYCYTQTELEDLGLWDNPAFEIKEVEK